MSDGPDDDPNCPTRLDTQLFCNQPYRGIIGEEQRAWHLTCQRKRFPVTSLQTKGLKGSCETLVCYTLGFPLL